MGCAGREEVCLWDWRAATHHLLNHQYPLAIAAAAAYYGSKKRVQAAAGAAPPAPPAAGPQPKLAVA